MIKILKETFAILNRNLWLLFLFMTISYIGLVYFMVLKSSAENAVQISIGLITLLFIVVAGIAGFFHCATETIDAEVSKDETKRFELLKTFPKGVGEYFLSSLGIVILYLIITFSFFALALVIGNNLIGQFSFAPEAFIKAMESDASLMQFLKTLTSDDIIKLSQWHLLYLAISSILTFLLIYWLPETFYKTKNALLALFYSIKKVILHPLKTLLLFITIAIINILTSFLLAFLMPIPILMFLVYFFYFYSLLYILLLTFDFYRANFLVSDTETAIANEEDVQENVLEEDVFEAQEETKEDDKSEEE